MAYTVFPNILIVGADVQIAIFAEHVGVGSKGDANTGLGLRGEGPDRRVGVGVEVIDAGLRRTGLQGIRG